MEQLIDFHAPEVQAVLDTLLKDRSTGKNIIWATDPPEELQTVMYEPVTDRSQITTQQLGLTHYEVVLPRMMKQTDTQQQRTRKKGEVFSPAWVCNKMNNALDMWQILENKQKFISQIMTSKSPVRACDDVDDTALSYAEIKALATGNPYIKEKMDLDIQVSKLKLLKANHTSQIYSLESDIARRYPREIAVAQGQIEALKTDMEAAKPLLAQDKDHFSMEISGKVYTERKEAGAAIIEACKALKAAGTEGRIGSYGAFELHLDFKMSLRTLERRVRENDCSISAHFKGRR